jgi:ATP-binding cassette subfamily C protein LapB
LFVRAAANAGLSARVVGRQLRAIPDLVLPAVLLQHGRRACVLVRRS